VNLARASQDFLAEPPPIRITPKVQPANASHHVRQLMSLSWAKTVDHLDG
jgi:hypothetical protein